MEILFGPLNMHLSCLNMYCKSWKWHDGNKWMCATVLLRTWSLAMKIFEDIAKSCWISFCFISSKIFNFKLQFLHDMVEDTAFYHCGHFWPCNAFLNREIEFFCFGEYELFDLLNMYYKVWRWQERMKWMCATVLWRIWSLAVNILEDIAKSCWVSFLFNSFQDIQLYASVPSWYGRRHYILSLGSFLTLQCTSKWGIRGFLFWWIWPFWPT